jgi:HK97 family phage prohead protease
MDRLGRAYSFIEVKAVNEDERTIEGVASTPRPDRVGDTVNPLGAKFALPLPMLWQHNHEEPVGHVEMAQPSKAGIPFKARLAKTDEPGRLKDRLDEAWQSLKLKLVQAVSIGFRPLKYNFLADGGIEYDEWEWLELSCVTIPANADCTITLVKSIDAQMRAEAGVPEPEIPTDPAKVAATGKGVRVVRLDEPARDRAKPFQIRTIIRTGT